MVIDVQRDTTGNTAFYGDTTSFVGSVNQAITFAEIGGMEILYVKNIASSNPIVGLLARGKYKKGTNEIELDSRLQLINGNVLKNPLATAFHQADLRNI